MQIYVKTAVLIAWMIAAYILLVFAAPHAWQSVPLAVSLGLAMAAVGFNVQHDGGHKAFSDIAWINRLAAMVLDLLGRSSYTWHHKHNTLHHTFVNIGDHDDDIDLGALARMAPHQPRRWFHRGQHAYLWPLYGFLAIKWQWWDDFLMVARGRIGSHRMPRPRGADLAIFIGGKTVFVSLAFIVPLFFHPFWNVLLHYVLAEWVLGLVISVTFQLAHVVEQAEFPQPVAGTGRLPVPWARHQVLSTVNFARRNRAVTWFLGGLNYQVEHHLFPRVCHIHYPQLSRIVERTCRRFELPYRAHPTLLAGVVSHGRWLRRMGQPGA